MCRQVKYKRAGTEHTFCKQDSELNRLLKLKSINNAAVNSQGIMPAEKDNMPEQDLASSFCYLERQYEIIICIDLCGFRIHVLFYMEVIWCCLVIYVDVCMRT